MVFFVSIYYIDFEINRQKKRLKMLKNIDMCKRMVAVRRMRGSDWTA
jgi:hypothetical protein